MEVERTWKLLDALKSVIDKLRNIDKEFAVEDFDEPTEEEDEADN
jgi:hypothetical protein